MRVIRVISAITLAFFGSLVIVTSANAHTDLISTSPVADSEVDVAPAVISLTFSEPVLEAGAAIVLNMADGTEVGLGELTFDGATVSITSPADLAPGEYTVTWRATADDGHVLTDQFSFTFNGVVTVVDPSIGASPMAQTGIEPRDAAQENSNVWIILIAAFVASSTIATIYVTKKRK